MDDSEDPYLGGVKYNAMPPMKRFRDMEQLSGQYVHAVCAGLACLVDVYMWW